MKIANKKIFIIIIIIVVALTLFLLFTRSDKEIKKFNNVFRIELAKETKVIYNKSIFGALGDGEGLTIYELSSKDMQEIIEQERIADWSKLPIPKEIYGKLDKKVGLDSEEIKEYLNLDLQEGFYAVMDRFGSDSANSIIRENMDFYKFENFTLGIISAKENKIYLYKYDQ